MRITDHYILGLGTRKNQQAQVLRIKQEKFQKLAVQAKQRGKLKLFSIGNFINLNY